ncbi:hypothetical protein CALVIDRAFT_560451 [Calocera viscosa TUFC12733]|uniref:Peptidase M48 domain-containing protein n=1 Tax=Calocera viscosa (strain TUFC12733) TaxID=1330018 RepID=A0A167R2E7_CALVF|nr:hypothetical protein CALVIDRAFT_560451 [Calocera viscosa TUFC12733]
MSRPGLAPIPLLLRRHARCPASLTAITCSLLKRHLPLPLPALTRHISTSSRALQPRFQLHPTTKDLLVRSGLQLAGKRVGEQRKHYVAPTGAFVDGRLFHATQARHAPPLLLWLVALLKSSATLNAAATVGRLTLSLLPWAWFRERMATRAIRLAQEHPDMAAAHPRWAGLVAQSSRWLGAMRWTVWVLAITPVALIAITCIASTERTPISGRWRMIMLSPEEEEQIHKDLKGYGWYTSVIKQMTEASSTGDIPKILNPTDWRWRWVEDTLRRLEAGINVIPASSTDAPSAAAERYYLTAHEKPGPVPPPARYPLLPRPRISQLVHALPPSVEADPDAEARRAADPENHTHHLAPHAQLGPPYNILLVDKPECNAFSHGYGPAGAGGIVLYTGFLDEILTHNRVLPKPLPPPPAHADQGLWSSLMGTEELAVVLAHELSHLILCHHLESLSSSLIVTPTLFAMLGDVGRTILFPLTMFFGPFLNDAIAKMFQVGHTQVMKSQLECTTKVLEVEADAVSARLLAYAGYDPRSAVRFWESRLGSDDLSCSGSSSSGGGSGNGNPPSSRRHGFEGKDHPLSEERLVELKAELARWERWNSRATATAAAAAAAPAPA